MTKPIEDILPKEFDSGVAEILTNFSATIDEFVNFGTHILKWIIQEPNGSDEQLPLFMFFRDMLEKADSISILVKNSSIEPSKIILRSIFELYLYIDYLTEKHFEDRSMAFLIWDTKRKIRLNKTFDKTDAEFNNLLRKIESDKSIFNKNIFSDLPSVKPALTNLNALLAYPQYGKVLKEFERTKNIDRNNPAWYRLYNGPKNIQQLAEHLQISTLYEILYRSWSGNVHSTDIIDGKIIPSDNLGINETKVKADIIQLRFPKDAQVVSSYTMILLLKTFLLLSDKKIQKKKNEILNWYLEMRPTFLKMTSGEQYIKIKY